MNENETAKTEEDGRGSVTDEGPSSPTTRQQLERIRMVRDALMPKALKGDVQSVAAILKCDEREADLLGIYGGKRGNNYVFAWMGEGGKDEAPPRPVLHTPAECAAILGVTPKTIRRAIERGKLAASRTPGGHYRISGEDLNRYSDYLRLIRE